MNPTPESRRAPRKPQEPSAGRVVATHLPESYRDRPQRVKADLTEMDG